MKADRTYTLKALTDIWTGDAEGKPGRTITTGLLGSIRWWFEVVVRGLGGSACDPTQTECQDRDHCVVCELFGCTGWARKFRFNVLAEDGTTQQHQIKKGQKFLLQFTPLRPIKDEEWALLDLAIGLIAKYGAIGGKTVYKPSDEQNRQRAPHHSDYGLVKVISQEPAVQSAMLNDLKLKRYVAGPEWRKFEHDDFAWASLANFWCVNGRYLARHNQNRSTFNRVIRRPEPKAQASQRDSDSWIAGRRAGQGRGPESKKVFSLKNPPRTFGFVQSPDELDEMRQRLEENAWNDLGNDEFLTESQILGSLFGRGGTP